MAVGLPFSKFLMSVSSMCITVAWILGGNYKEKFVRLKQNKLAILMMLVYVFHLAGLFYSNDWGYGLKDLRIKLPLLLFPFVFFSMSRLKIQQFNNLLYLFCGSVFVFSIIPLLAKYGVIERKVESHRDLSLFISHIRFGLMVTFSFFALIHLWIQNKKRWFLIIMMVWVLYVLFLLKSLTGLAALMTGFLLLLVYLIRSKEYSKRLKFITLGSFLAVVSFFTFHLSSVVKDYFYVNELVINDLKNLPQKTPDNNSYTHLYENKQLENGNYIWMNVCWDELEEEWEKRSEVSFYEKNHRGESIYGTVIRYMTHKGMAKDARNFKLLSDEEIQRIEKGKVKELQQGQGLRGRINVILFELDAYINGGNPSGNSLSQRFEYWKHALFIVRENLLIGVGTGDVQHAFNEIYVRENSELEENRRLRSHNQFLTIAVALGVVGFLVFMVFVIYPFAIGTSILSKIFWIILTVSFLVEDTLESQVGVSFAVFFYCLLNYRLGGRFN